MFNDLVNILQILGKQIYLWKWDGLQMSREVHSIILATWIVYYQEVLESSKGIRRDVQVIFYQEPFLKYVLLYLSVSVRNYQII